MYEELENVFLSYDRIVEKLNDENITTKTGNIITHKDLRQAVDIMQKKHCKCRWKSEKINSKKYLILVEGYYWIKYVYFSKDKSMYDADIKFFIDRIKQYEQVLKIEYKELFNEDIKVEELNKYFNRSYPTIKRAILKLDKEYRYKIDDINYVSKTGIKWLCENCFKHKYLELLEDYKMELTEKYIQAGYIYDNFFQKN